MRILQFMISDFLDPHVEPALSLISRKHDVVPIVLFDPREHQLLNSGILSLEDNETGETLYLNSSLSSVREAYQNIILTQQLELDRVFKSLKLDCIKLDISKSYLGPLSHYFIKRSKRV